MMTSILLKDGPLLMLKEEKETLFKPAENTDLLEDMINLVSKPQWLETLFYHLIIVLE